jgi:hypothetical protein
MSTRELTIFGVKFEIAAPFAEGHVVNTAEAHTLNQTRAENVSNLVRKKVADAKGAGDWTDESIAAAAKIVADADAAYAFGIRQAAGPRATKDPVEREALVVAKAVLAEKLKNKGQSAKDFTKEALAEAIETLAANEKIITLAKRRLHDRAKLAELVE